MTWKAEKTGLTKEFNFNNFVEAVAFVDKIVPLAEAMNHHPDVLIYAYKKVKITLFTHSEKKITKKDYILAKRIDQIEKDIKKNIERVEEIIKEAHEVISPIEINKRLPEKMNANILQGILRHLQESGKIVIGTKGVLWVFTERKELDALIQRGTEI